MRQVPNEFEGKNCKCLLKKRLKMVTGYSSKKNTKQIFAFEMGAHFQGQLKMEKKSRILSVKMKS